MLIQLKKLVQSLKSRGILGTSRWIYRSYFTVNNFIVFYKKLGEPFNYTSFHRSVGFRVLDLDELQNMRKQIQGLPIEFYCDITHNFTKPFVAFVDGKLAAIHWLVLSREESRFLELKENDVEINYNTVLHEYRGMGLAEQLMAVIINYCNEMGYHRMFGVVNVSNIPQYKQMLRLGFEPVEVLTHFGLRRPKAKLRYVKQKII